MKIGLLPYIALEKDSKTLGLNHAALHIGTLATVVRLAKAHAPPAVRAASTMLQVPHAR